MNKDIKAIMISEEEIGAAVSRVAAEIDRDYGNVEGRVLLLAILKGSVVFMGDLMKKITLPVEIDFMKVSSYGADTKSSGNINIILDLARKDIDSCNIIIVEDIIDSGKTLSYLVEYLRHKGAKSVRTCTLLDKPSRREVDFTPDYVGLEVEDEFVVGYGLDYDEQYRALPYIGILRPEVYGESEGNA
ncbi:MAG: hypoxanthine phosphoribosyltransferase [Clostridia bacterium]|nr:hypoxanthine phosphoribosyltransferase [Clostridia bacterium]